MMLTMCMSISEFMVKAQKSKTESIGLSGKNGGKGGVIAMTSYDVRCSRAFASVRRSAVHQTIGGKSANQKSEIRKSENQIC